MNFADWVVIAVVVLLLAGALYLGRRRRTGCCSSGDSCGGCSCGCRRRSRGDDGKDNFSA